LLFIGLDRKVRLASLDTFWLLSDDAKCVLSVKPSRI
jgi:hypothetical protein